MVIGDLISNDVTELVFTLTDNTVLCVLGVTGVHNISFRNLCCVIMSMLYTEGKVAHVVSTQLRGTREWHRWQYMHVLCVYNELHDVLFTKYAV
jgi:hypothetical protein